MTRESSMFLRALLRLLLSTAAFFCGASASTNITTTGAALTTNAFELSSETPPTEAAAATVRTTAGAPNISTTSRAFSGTPTTPAVRPDSSPTAVSPPPPGSEISVAVCTILFFCFLIVLFFYAFKWYVRNGRPSFAEMGRGVAERARNAWAAAVGRLRGVSETAEDEREDEEVEAGIKMEEDQQPNNRGGGGDADSNDDSSDYTNVGGTGWTKKSEENEEDEMSSVELTAETETETERGKDERTAL